MNTGVGGHSHVPVRGSRVCTEGDYEIAGVSGSAARIDLEWLEPGGSTTGRTLPTGHARDRFLLASGRTIEVSIVDAANPVVFCAASALGLTGAELPATLDAHNIVYWTALVEGSGNLLYRLSLNTLLDGLAILAETAGTNIIYSLGMDEYSHVDELLTLAKAIGASKPDQARRTAQTHLARTVDAAYGAAPKKR